MEKSKRQLPWEKWYPSPFVAAFDKAGSAVGAIGSAGLDWEVGLAEPVYVNVKSEDDPRERRREVTRHRAVFRKDAGLPLGVVGTRYEPIQNHEFLEFVDAFLKVADLSATPAAIREFDEGRRVCIMMKLRGRITKLSPTLGLIDEYLVMTNAHDGTAALRVGILPIRKACTNQLGLELGRKDPGVWSFRHLRRIAEHLKESLMFIERYREGFNEVMTRLASDRFSREDFEGFLERLIAIPPHSSERTVDIREGYREGIRDAYRDRDNKALAGTKWGALNAVAEWEQWIKPMHAPEGTVRMDWLFEKLMMGRGNEYANRALRLLS